MLQTVAYYLAFMVVGITTASFGPSLPGFARNTGAALSDLGLLFVFHRIGYMTGSLTGGRLIDHFRGNRITGIVLFVIAAGLVSVAFAGTLFFLFAVILVLGLAQGTAEVGSNIGIVRLHGDKSGPYMNGLHLCFGLGAMTAPLILTLSRGVTGAIRGGFILLACLAAGSAYLMFRIPSSGGHEASPKEEAVRKSDFTVISIAALLFFTIAGEAGFSGWVYSYSLKTELAGEAEAGLLTSAFWLSLTIGRLVGIDLIRRLGTRRLLLLNVGGAFIAASLFFFFPPLTANR